MPARWRSRRTPSFDRVHSCSRPSIKFDASAVNPGFARDPREHAAELSDNSAEWTAGFDIVSNAVAGALLRYAAPVTGDRAREPSEHTPRREARTEDAWAGAPVRAAWRQASESAKTSFEVLRAAPLDPPEKGQLSQISYGFSLPFAIVRVLLRDEEARKRYLAQSVLRAAVVLGVGVAVVLYAGEMAKGLGEALTSGFDISVRIGHGAAALSSLYATLCAVEWVLIALTREFDDQMARRAALLIGDPPEDPERAPRVRVDVGWTIRKVKRRIRGFRVFVLGLPVLALTSLIPAVGHLIYAGLTTAWGAYWLAVFTAAKTALAWKDEGHAPEPWFLRRWGRATSTTIGLRWWLPRTYGRLWRRHTEDVFSPCKSVEDSPASMFGLTLLRAACGIPVLYLFFRPVIPVAAAHIILARERALAARGGVAARALTSCCMARAE